MNWTGKKSPTNPVKKEKHEERKTKEGILQKLERQDWEQEVKDFLTHNRTNNDS